MRTYWKNLHGAAAQVSKLHDLGGEEEGSGCDDHDGPPGGSPVHDDDEEHWLPGDGLAHGRHDDGECHWHTEVDCELVHHGLLGHFHERDMTGHWGVEVLRIRECHGRRRGHCFVGPGPVSVHWLALHVNDHWNVDHGLADGEMVAPLAGHPGRVQAYAKRGRSWLLCKGRLGRGSARTRSRAKRGRAQSKKTAARKTIYAVKRDAMRMSTQKNTMGWMNMSKMTKHKSGYEHQHKARLKGTRQPARNMVPITACTMENYECWIVVINGEMVKNVTKY